jgi:hypothetical protein
MFIENQQPSQTNVSQAEVNIFAVNRVSESCIVVSIKLLHDTSYILGIQKETSSSLSGSSLCFPFTTAYHA